MNLISYLQNCFGAGTCAAVKNRPALEPDTEDMEYGELLPGSGSSRLLGRRLQALLARHEGRHAMPVILCIGTDRIIGDSLGPLVGTSLQKTRALPYLYGTLSAPVHALNLPETLEDIKIRHPDSTVIAVDASLGSASRVGAISVRDGGLRPGAGVSKNLSLSGDISITGITNQEDGYPWLSLQTARLSTVIAMADCIAAGIQEALL